MEGLFSGLTPQQVMEQERQARSKLNLSLAQSADPLSGTLFRGAETADALRRNVADVFGNPIQDSAAVQAAKEQEGFRNEIARMMQEGIAAGEPREETAKKIQSFLLSKGKVAEAEQMRAQGITEAQTATEATAKVGKLEAETKKALAEANRQKIPAYGADYEAAAKALGTTFDQLTPEQAAQVVKEVNDRKVEVAKGGVASTISTAANVQLNKISENLSNTNEYLKSLAALKSKTELPMVSGSASATRLNILKYINDLGFAGTLTQDQIDNTEAFSSGLVSLLLDKIGGSLGAGITESDRKAIEKMVGTLDSNPSALKAIFTMLEARGIEKFKTLRKQEEHYLNVLKTGTPTKMNFGNDSYDSGTTSLPSGVTLPPSPAKPSVNVNKTTAEYFKNNPSELEKFQEFKRSQGFK